MFDIMILSDFHINKHKKNEIYLDTIKLCFEKIYKILDTNEIKYIFILGDIFDEGNFINKDYLFIFKTFLNELNKRWIRPFIISGNHDIFDNRTNILDMFDDKSMVIKNKEIVIINNNKFCLLPYSNKLVQNDVEIKCDVLLTHLDFKTDKYYFGDNPLNVPKKEMIKLVISGHVHEYIECDNLIYLGSLYPFSYGSSNEKGILLLDSVSLEHKFININEFVYFYDIPISNLEILDNIDIEKSNIRFLIDKDYNIEELKKKYNNALDITFKDIRELIKEEIKIDTSTILSDINDLILDRIKSNPELILLFKSIQNEI